MTGAPRIRIGAELLVDSLDALGVQHVFGVPGGAVLPILEVLAERGPRFVVCRHETGAAFMAQAWGRVTGQPGVVLTTSGPGLVNVVCGVATATEDRDPLVVITGQVSRALQFKQSHMNLDSVSLFAPITKWSVEVEEPNTLSEILVNAFRIATAPRAGAVHISVSTDVAKAPVTAVALSAVEPPHWGPAPDGLLDHAAALLRAARAPALLLGLRAGTPVAAAAVRRFLHRHGLPVAMTFEAAGALSHDLVEHFVGRVGYVRNQAGDEVLRQSDLVLTIGYDPIEFEPSAWASAQTRVIHLDALPAVVDRDYRPAVELVGDIALSLDALGDRVRLAPPALRPDVIEACRRVLEDQGRGATLSGRPIHPLRFIHDLRATLADDVTVTCDVGSHEIWMARYFRCHAPRHLLFSMGHQTMGVALPWAIGAALARPGENVVSVSGDGSFMMTCMELETAVRLKLPTVHIVWKDGGYNLIQALQVRDYGRTFGAAFGPTDFVKLAEAFGATGYRIDDASDIIPVLKQALAAESPVVIEVPIDYRDNAALVGAMSASSQH
jgi:acetolactate synthase-1/2/3 large subunit